MIVNAKLYYKNNLDGYIVKNNNIEKFSEEVLKNYKKVD